MVLRVREYLRTWRQWLVPRTLMGRSFMIVLAPMVLVQAIGAFIFFDRHVDSLTRLMASQVANDIAAVLYQVDTEPLEKAQILARHLKLEIHPYRAAPVKKLHVHGALEEALGQRLSKHFSWIVRIKESQTHLWVKTKKNAVMIVVPNKRLFSSTAMLFCLWSGGTAAFLGWVACLFMRGQLRPLEEMRRAAHAYDSFEWIRTYQPRGAQEIRQIGTALKTLAKKLHAVVQERTHMLAGLSHDLRTPLARMKLQLALMPFNEDVREMKEDVEQMTMMVNEYLSFAQGQMQEQPKQCNIPALIYGVQKRIFRHVPCQFSYHGPVKAWACVKKEALRRVITNVLENALRYAQTQVSVTLISQQGDIEVSIEDDGIGVPDHAYPHLGSPFFRVDDARNLQKGGVGLGLSIAKIFLVAQGGSLSFAPSSMGGLKVTFTLPLGATEGGEAYKYAQKEDISGFEA